ncbi:putative NADH-dependent fumarate reductase [Trypanosoma cruzi]|uniref:fumarate reductase (NADH) n=1 Tax=Trypanosoma cruzi TaxID=5693 RepID=A0A2V2W0K7_TRYCR|nr:putative NADH-dependent fumarate reductase [Trypanosoma cruzi]
MDKVQLHPTGLIDPKDPANPTKYLGPEALRGSGGVLLNKKGERFVNELDLRSVVSNAIIEQGDEYPDSGGSKFAFCVLNDAAVRLFGVNSHGFYWKSLGLFVKADTVEKLAALIGCPVENVRNTLGDYEQLSKENRQCPKTRKVVYPCVVGPQGPFYVAFVTPSIHYTMGGCLISLGRDAAGRNHDLPLWPPPSYFWLVWCGRGDGRGAWRKPAWWQFAAGMRRLWPHCWGSCRDYPAEESCAAVI